MNTPIDKITDLLWDPNAEEGVAYSQRRREIRAAMIEAINPRLIEQTIHSYECGCEFEGEHSWKTIARREQLSCEIFNAIVGKERN